MAKEVSIMKSELKKERWELLAKAMKLFFKENPEVKPDDILVTENEESLIINAKEEEIDNQTEDEIALEEMKLRNEVLELSNKQVKQVIKADKQEAIRRNIEVLLKVAATTVGNEITTVVHDKLKKHIEALEVVS